MKQFYLAAFALAATSAMAMQPAQATKLLTPAQGAEVSNDIIYYAPDGETKYYAETFAGWVYWGEWAGLTFLDGENTNEIVWCDNGEVYIKNPVGVWGTDSYAKGAYADGKITLQLPQCIGGYYDENYEVQYLYLNKMEEVEEEGEKYYMICNDEDNYATYDVDADGNIALNIGNDGNHNIENGINPQYLLGITYSNEPHALQVWSGYGDAEQNWALLDLNPVTPPAEAQVQEWAFETKGQKSIIKVVEDGDDIYLDGFTSYVQGYWFKGTREGDKIVFPAGQYMGMNEWGQLYYFMAGELYYNAEWDWWDYSPIGAVTLVYNAETGRYVAEEGQVFVVSMSNESLQTTAAAENPILWKQDPEMLEAAPLAPYVDGFVDFDPGMGQGSITWMIPNINEKGAVLPTTSMYYNMYSDGDLFEFWPDEYPLFQEPTINVPYDASNYYDIYVYQQVHTIYFKYSDPVSFGLKSFYESVDGTVYESELVTYVVESDGINGALAVKEVASVAFTTLSGVKVENPASGLYIKTTTYTDGTRRVEKVAIR